MALHHCFDLLAANPNMGRKADYLKPLLRRYEFRSHVIFYYHVKSEIQISRVLGAEMDFEKHI